MKLTASMVQELQRAADGAGRYWPDGPERRSLNENVCRENAT